MWQSLRRPRGRGALAFADGAAGQAGARLLGGGGEQRFHLAALAFAGQAEEAVARQVAEQVGVGA
jgi:hypothetical protein